MWNLNPWQTLLWIAALEIITLPLLVGFISSIFDAWFRAKEKSIGRLVRATGKMLTEIGKSIKEKSQKKEVKAEESFEDLIAKIFVESKKESTSDEKSSDSDSDA